MIKRYAKKTFDVDFKDVEFIESLGFDRECSVALAGRGITRENYREYFDNDFFIYHDPFLMTGMDKIVDIVSKTIKNGGKILVYGDYDADGLTASAILKLFFEHNGIDCRVIIPTREDGYGLHVDLVMQEYQKQPFDLLITVDCGISNREEVQQIKEKIDVQILVTDHHELPQVLPDCPCINCKIGYPFAYLSGAGVALKLVEALSDRQTALLYADIASVGTIADMMPLSDENRSIVKQGIANFNHRGLIKLAETTKCEFPLTATCLAMKICPKINSAGRVGSPYKALDLLLMQGRATTDAVGQLIECNVLRQKILDEVLIQAKKQLDFVSPQEKMLFFVGEDWQHGILGIAANRFKDICKKPCAFLTADGDNYVGSARSSGDTNIFDAFAACSDLLVRFGGHKNSVGFTVAKQNFKTLKQKIYSVLPQVTAEQNIVAYDVDFIPLYANKDYYDKLYCLEPQYPNDKLVFCVNDYCVSASVFATSHLKFTLGCGLELKAFNNYTFYYPALKDGAECTVLFTLEYDRYLKKVCGTVVDMELRNSLNLDGLYALNYINNMYRIDYDDFCCVDEVRELLKKPDTVAIFNSYLDFDFAAKTFDFDDYYLGFCAVDKPYDKYALISPKDETSFAGCKNAIVFGNYGDGYVQRYFSEEKYAALRLPKPSFLDTIELDRKVCVEVFKAIKGFSNGFSGLDSFNGVFIDATKQQIALCIKVFEQLGIIKKENGKFFVDMSCKNNLENSVLYNMFKKQ